MAILMFTARIHDLIGRISTKQSRLQDLTRKLSDLQQYAANISDGNISIYDMMNTPCSMFGRTMMYMQYAHNSALMNAQNNYNQMDQAGIIAQQTAQMQDPNMVQQYQNWIMQNLYKQERERIGKIEAKLLNQQEKEIQQEKEKLEASIKMDEQELESAKKARDKGIEQFAPKYTG